MYKPTKTGESEMKLADVKTKCIRCDGAMTIEVSMIEEEPIKMRS